MNGIGLPHSGIPGLTPACGYPRLIAAYHALHRLLVPRHPPPTLSSLTHPLEHRNGYRTGFCRFFNTAFSIQLSKISRPVAAPL